MGGEIGVGGLAVVFFGLPAIAIAIPILKHFNGLRLVGELLLYLIIGFVTMILLNNAVKSIQPPNTRYADYSMMIPVIIASGLIIRRLYRAVKG